MPNVTLRLVSPRWAAFTGKIQDVAFSNGVSTVAIPRMRAEEIAASIDAVDNSDGSAISKVANVKPLARMGSEPSRLVSPGPVAPTSLDSVAEIAAALGGNPNYASDVTAVLATKAAVSQIVRADAVQAPNVAAQAIAQANIGLKATSGAYGALGQASKRRVDVLMFGDSHQNYGNYGYLNGFGVALGARFGVYASGVLPFSKGYSQYLQGGPNIVTLQSDNGGDTGWPAGFDAFKLTDKHSPNYYSGTGYIGGGSLVATTPSNAFAITPAANLRAHYAYGTGLTSAGSFYPTWRDDATGAALVGDAAVSTAGSVGLAIGKLDITPSQSASTRAALHNQRFTLGNGYRNTGGPTISFWNRLENLDQMSGVALTSWYSEGGQSAWDAATWLAAQTDTQILNMFKAARYLQEQVGQDPLVVVYLCFGHNDQNEAGVPTRGPLALGSAPSSSLAYVDNHRYIYNRLRAVWDATWHRDGLSFLLMTSHPSTVPDTTNLLAYRAALARFAAGKRDVSFNDLNELMTADQINAAGGFDNPGYNTNTHSADNIHLLPASYVFVAATTVNNRVVSA